MAKAGKNHDGSDSKLWKAMACETRSGPDELPAGGVTERFSTSLRWPEDRLRSMRPAPEASALSVAVPVSSSEPAMRRAVPTSVTSLMGCPPVRAAREFCKERGLEGWK